MYRRMYYSNVTEQLGKCRKSYIKLGKYRRSYLKLGKYRAGRTKRVQHDVLGNEVGSSLPEK